MESHRQNKDKESVQPNKVDRVQLSHEEVKVQNKNDHDKQELQVLNGGAKVLLGKLKSGNPSKDLGDCYHTKNKSNHDNDQLHTMNKRAAELLQGLWKQK